MQLAVAEGPNHWPGCFPQAEAPWWTNRWMEKGALGSSANMARILASASPEEVLLRQSRPWCKIIKALASRLCPDRIIQPHPVSLLKPSRSARLRNRTARVMDDVAEGSWDLGMGGKLDRYVIHIFDSKSSRNCGGQPPADSLLRDGTSPSTMSASSKLPLGWTDTGDSGLVERVEVVVSDGGFESAEDAISTISPWSVVDTGFGGGEVYSRPRHQMGRPLWSLFLISGS